MMNDRIRALAQQAGYLPDVFGIGHWDMPECKKFAELIVRECSGIAEGGWADPAHQIRQHFGVER